MSRPGIGNELTFILGPPLEAEARRAFDEYQAAMAEGREGHVRRYQELEREFLGEIFVGSGADEASAFSELLAGGLGARIRVRRAGIDVAMMKGLWVVAVTIRREDVEFEALAPVAAFPPDRATCEALGASLGQLLKREWCLWSSTAPRVGGAGACVSRRFGRNAELVAEP